MNIRRLFADDPDLRGKAERLASITWEFTEFIVDGLGISDLHGRLPQAQTFAFHDSCHGLRLLGLGDKPAEHWWATSDNATIVDWDNSETCCGFGGLFSVKMADVSGAMLQKKMDHIEESDAERDFERRCELFDAYERWAREAGCAKRVKHIADVLAEGIRQEDRDGSSVQQLYSGSPESRSMILICRRPFPLARTADLQATDGDVCGGEAHGEAMRPQAAAIRRHALNRLPALLETGRERHAVKWHRGSMGGDADGGKRTRAGNRAAATRCRRW